jgi:hypothetical protein
MCVASTGNRYPRLYLINPAILGSVRLFSGMQMIGKSQANGASMFGT